MPTAEFIRKLDWKSDARFYKLSEPVKWHDYKKDRDKTTNYVIVSGVYIVGEGEETLVFPADKNGEAFQKIEIGGFRGSIDHDGALEGMGYDVR